MYDISIFKEINSIDKCTYNSTLKLFHQLSFSLSDKLFNALINTIKSMPKYCHMENLNVNQSAWFTNLPDLHAESAEISMSVAQF